MKKSLSLTLAALGFAAIFAPTTAVAAEAADLATTTTEGITWVEAAVPAGDHDKVAIKIYNVGGGSTSLWQRCSFTFTGTGTYRCGIDTEAGSLAAEHDGRWVAKAFVDGNQVTRHAFTF